MKVKWWGHSTFFIENNGIKIITDPYDDSLPYHQIEDKADYVTVSHGHYDHNSAELLGGNFEVIDSLDGLKNSEIEIEAIKSYHDSHHGEDRGDNLIFLINIGDKKICHLGDLGHLLDANIIEKIKNVDLLLIPVGGNYTIDAELAFIIARDIDPAAIIPMHYKTDILDFPINGVKNFTDKFEQNEVEFINRPEVDIENFKDKRVIVLDYV
ncbi:L-ascorbate metabolism protein UlaG (beta-lactamase superfamily) [Halanaerobium saccharolyticum]|uniref:L-ascorbate metabolism protein UlaG (Beta-lactamase superfamily) n=1 Tax=Halanaerobium saccharolyticum TaxID=43595 RepID=A0A4R6LRI2_9FIRM|nr:MBL fold metallo-hydrolase [Halanaerobium saccharolyticum]TDO86500.1 L-ascorbate metabolism protein UlaG (beta-lactamase superfamily) [Halanaerobium saccharolyticum]